MKPVEQIMQYLDDRFAEYRKNWDQQTDRSNREAACKQPKRKSDIHLGYYKHQCNERECLRIS